MQGMSHVCFVLTASDSHCRMHNEGMKSENLASDTSMKSLGEALESLGKLCAELPRREEALKGQRERCMLSLEFLKSTPPTGVMLAHA